MIESNLNHTSKQDRLTRILLKIIGVYSVLFVSFLNIFVLGEGEPDERAIILMADGLILIWLVIGGLFTPKIRDWVVPLVKNNKMNWKLRFILLCTLLVLIEEAITTTMTNLAPLFGSTPEAAHITASTNYFTVVAFHSAVIIVPMFIAWSWILARWKFTPLQVMLLFGITGSIAEATVSPPNFFGGFWVFVYGLMIYVPACTIPDERDAILPRWWHFPMAVLLPLIFVIPFVPPIIWIRNYLGIEFLPGLI